MSIKLRKKADEIYKQIAGQPVPDAELGDGAERSEAKSSEAGVCFFISFVPHLHGIG